MFNIIIYFFFNKLSSPLDSNTSRHPENCMTATYWSTLTLEISQMVKIHSDQKRDASLQINTLLISHPPLLCHEVNHLKMYYFMVQYTLPPPPFWRPLC